MNALLDLNLVVILELRPIRAEYLDAVIRVRIMRRGDHQPARITQPLREQGDRGSRNNTRVLNRREGQTETLLKQIENPRARHARVLSDQNFSSEFLSDGPADRNDRRRIQRKFACASSNTIRAKQLRTHVTELTRGHSFFPLSEIAVVTA